MKSIFTILILSASMTILSGCGDPTDRQSNPLQDYNGLNKDVPVQTAQKSNLYCGSTYSITIRGLNDQGAEIDSGNNMQFVVGEPKSYHIYVESKLPMDLSLSNNPDGMDLTKITDSRWDLHWQPKASDSGATDTVDLLGTATGKSNCHPTQLGQVHITTNTGNLQPTISITGVTSNKAYSPTDRVAFMVTVEDPTLSSTGTPAAPTFQFPTKDSSNNKTPYLTAKNVVQCGAPQVMSAPWTFRVSCALNINQIVAQNPNAQGLSIADMVVNVKSTTGEAANPYPVKVTIQLPSATATPTTSPASDLENKNQSSQKSTGTGVGT